MKNINSNRIRKLCSLITAFSKPAYTREENFPELLKLQRQLVELVFNETHAELANLRIGDVIAHLIQINEAKGHPADKQLEKVSAYCNAIQNLISSEIAGTAGEKKAFWALQKIRGVKKIMKNVEITVGERRTEIDAILFTSKAIYIVEVKNPRKDVIIDERGNYFRSTHSFVPDKNIGEKMTDKVYLLESALQDTELSDLNIESLVVFTNCNINVDNRFPFIRTCFVSELPYVIDGYFGDELYTEEDINRMSQMIEAVSCKEIYPAPFDVDEFKIAFASLMVCLEDAETLSNDAEENDESSNIEQPLNAETVENEVNADSNNSVLLAVVSCFVGLVIGILGTCIAGNYKHNK